MRKQNNRKNINRKVLRKKTITDSKNPPKIFRRKRVLGDLGIMYRNYPNKSDRDEIVKSINQIIEEDRSSVDWWELGEYTIYDGLMDEDDSKFNTGMKFLKEGADHPDVNPACLLDLGWCFMWKKMDVMALDYLKKAVEIAPKSRDAWSLLGLCYVGNNDKERAMAAYEQAIAFAQDETLAQTDRDTFQKIKNCTDLKETRDTYVLRKSDLEDSLVNQYSSSEQAKVVIFTAKAILEQKPGDLAALTALAYSRYHLRQYEEANEVSKKILSISKKNFDAFLIRAMIYTKTKKPEKSIKLYYKALALKSDHQLCLVNISSALADLGKFFEAREFLQRALAGDKDTDYYPIALHLYGNTIAHIEEDFNEEVKYHKEAIARLKDHSKLAVFASNLIMSLLSAGMATEAKKYFQKYDNSLRTLPNYRILKALNKTFSSRHEHPLFYLTVIEELRPMFHYKGIEPLVQLAFNNLEKAKKTAKDSIEHYWESMSAEETDYYNFNKSHIPDDEKIEKILFAQTCNQLGVVAAQLKDPELARKVFEYGYNETGDSELGVNLAQQWAACGNATEGISVIEKIQPVKGQRYHSISGNIRMNENKWVEAIDCYELAVKHDEKFLLPISNALDSIAHGKVPERVPFFLDALRTYWKNDFEGKILEARSLALQGFPRSASGLLTNALTEEVTEKNGKIVLMPEQVQKKIRPDEDITILGSENIRIHKVWAENLILSKNFQLFEILHRQIMLSKKWMDGDWTVYAAESARRQGNYDQAIKLCKSMPSQPPPLITKALCCLETENYKKAKRYAKKIIEFGTDAAAYNHLEGNPKSIAYSILAIVSRNDGKLKKASANVQKALNIDNGCVIASITQVALLRECKATVSEIKLILLEAIKKYPGHPALVKLLIEISCEFSFFDEAKAVLSKYNDNINEFEPGGFIEKLSEMIAIAELASIKNADSDLQKEEFKWTKQLSSLSQKWFINSVQLSAHKLKLIEANFFFLSKIAEKELGDRISEPFKESLVTSVEIKSKNYDDFARFINGNYAPSLGALHRLLEAARKDPQPDDEILINAIRQFISRNSVIDEKAFTERSFLTKLNKLSHARNSVAHIGETSAEKLERYGSFIIRDGKPGELLQAIGIS